MVARTVRDREVASSNLASPTTKCCGIDSPHLTDVLSVIYTLDMKTMINIKADKEVKENAQRIAKELGLPLSTVINAYLREFIRSREVHLSALPRMTPVLERLLRTIEHDLARGKNVSPTFSSAEQMDEYLDSL